MAETESKAALNFEKARSPRSVPAAASTLGLPQKPAGTVRSGGRREVTASETIRSHVRRAVLLLALRLIAH